MFKTLQEVVKILNDFVLNDPNGHLVFELAKKVTLFSEDHPDLLSAKVYADSGYDPEMGSSWNDLVVEDENGYSNILFSFDKDSCIYANSGYDPEMQSDWNDVCIDVDGLSMTVLDLND